MSVTPSAVHVSLAATLLAACAPQTVDAVTSEVCVSDLAGGGCGNSGGTASSGGASSTGGAATGGATTTGGSGNGGGISTGVRPLCRYSFDGLGTQVVDSEGNCLDGTIVNAELTGGGEVVLSGGDQYVDLPNQLLDKVTSATFESWLSWDGGSPWQRIFDFGEDETGEDGSRSAPPRDYFFFTVQNYANQGSVMRVTYLRPGGGEIILDAETAFPISEAAHHVAVVVDTSNRAVRLYLDGELQASLAPFNATLADIYDINNWLGRSQFTPDPSLSGRYLEFRLYDVALTPSQVRTSYDAGPDASFQ